MNDLLVGAGTALWLGLLTSISPCPLATNIAAISYTGKNIQHPGKALTAGALYTAGRMAAYTAIGMLLVSSMLSAPSLSRFLQVYMNKLLGPVLILSGMFLLELIRLRMPGKGIGDGLQKRVASMGMLGAFLLGMLFAVSFCPVSAALFFGSLIPVALQHESPILLPSLYGAATGVPVLIFAGILALSAQKLGSVFNALSAFELWARRITGGVFIVTGIYLTLKYVFSL